MMETPSIIQPAFGGSTVRIFTIHFTGIAGIMILMFMTHIILGTHLHLPGVGDGEIAGTHLIHITAGDTVIHLTTVTGTDLTMADGVIPIIVHGTGMVDTTEVITTVVGMPILITIVTAEGLPVQPM